MSPPPAAALALLGIWVLAVFFVTNEAGYSQLLLDDAVSVPDTEPEFESATGTDESGVDARTDADRYDSSDGATLDPSSDVGQKQESDPSSDIRSPADD